MIPDEDTSEEVLRLKAQTSAQRPAFQKEMKLQVFLLGTFQKNLHHLEMKSSRGKDKI